MQKPWWMPEDVEPQQIVAMYDTGMSVGAICRAIGLDATARQSSVNYYLRRVGVQIRALPKACEICSEPIDSKGTGQKYCSTCIPNHKWLRIYNVYKLTKPQYDEMYERQSGLCDLCELPLDDDRYATHIDHCHKTGKVRSLLHRKCNIALHYIENDKFLGAAIKYLERHKV